LAEAAVQDARSEQTVNQHGHAIDAALEELKNTNLTLEAPRQDIRGRKVIDQTGEAIGHVTALFIDEEERKVRMLEVRAGGFLGLGDRHFLLPAEMITSIVTNKVRVNETRERIVNTPAYDPNLTEIPIPETWKATSPSGW
jgi:sporulation protein YlmC with PRC-barrel domain